MPTPAHSPAITSSSAAASATECAIGPTVAMAVRSWRPYGSGTRPREGLMPKRWQKAEGMRMEPAPSLPWAMGVRPAASAAPAPPEEPPEVRWGSHGLRVGGWMSGSVIGIAPSSLVAVLPRSTKPPARRRFTVWSSNGETNHRHAREPSRVYAPLTKLRSFTAMGTP